MRRIRRFTAAAVLATTVLVTAVPSTSSAAEDTRRPTTLTGSSFLVDPAPSWAPTAAVLLKFEAVLSDQGSALSGRDVFFSAGGQPICRAVTNPFGRATCSALGNLNLGTILAVVTLQAKAEYRGNAQYQPSSVVLPAVGPSFGPDGPLL